MKTETAAAVIEALRPFSVQAEACNDMTCLYEAAERLCKEAAHAAWDAADELEDGTGIDAAEAVMIELHEAARKCGDPLINVAVSYCKPQCDPAHIGPVKASSM